MRIRVCMYFRLSLKVVLGMDWRTFELIEGLHGIFIQGGLTARILSDPTFDYVFGFSYPSHFGRSSLISNIRVP